MNVILRGFIQDFDIGINKFTAILRADIPVNIRKFPRLGLAPQATV